MKLSAALVGLVAVTVKVNAGICAPYQSCGGIGWSGPVNCCPPGTVCVYVNEWYSQCEPVKSSTVASIKPTTKTTSTVVAASTKATTSTTTKTTTSHAPQSTAGCVRVGATGTQCGGIGWTGPFTCPSGGECIYINEWTSLCMRCPSTTSRIASGTPAP